MNELLNKIFSEHLVEDAENNKYQLHSHTHKEQCEFLMSIIQEIKPANSLEIGLAYGVSTLAILEALNKSTSSFHHIVIDPYQINWKNIGLLNIERSGHLKNITFYPKFSDQVLPMLYNDCKKIQFAYIDSTKVFDVLMTDFYFINKILEVNGIIVFDDCGYPGIRLLARYISQLPGYKIFKVFSIDKPSRKLKFAKNIYLGLISLLPFRKKVLPSYNFKRDKQLGVNYNCIAFMKIKEDDRNWNWFESF